MPPLSLTQSPTIMPAAHKRQGALAKSSELKNTGLIDQLIDDMKAIKNLPAAEAHAKAMEAARKAAADGPASVYDSTKRIAEEAAAAHARLVKRASSIEGRHVYFARVVKNLGPYFLLSLVAKNAAGKDTVYAAYGSPMGRLKQKKAQIRFTENDIIIVEGFIAPEAGSTKQIITVEMTGIVGRSLAMKLCDEGFIHANVFPQDQQNDPTLFDYEDQQEEEEEQAAGGGGGREGKRGDKKSAVLQQELEVNIEDL
jgi:hypothetical protein